jgi:hypothetical protein
VRPVIEVLRQRKRVDPSPVKPSQQAARAFFGRPWAAALNAVGRVEDRSPRKLKQERALVNAQPHLSAEVIEATRRPIHLGIVSSTARYCRRECAICLGCSGSISRRKPPPRGAYEAFDHCKRQTRRPVDDEVEPGAVVMPERLKDRPSLRRAQVREFECHPVADHVRSHHDLEPASFVLPDIHNPRCFHSGSGPRSAVTRRLLLPQAGWVPSVSR